jgi:dTDP-4-dehydrorhamnose 3,5-epimerase
MNIVDTPLDGLKLVQSSPHRDDRGEFVRLFCARELHDVLGNRQIVQINRSRTTQAGMVRGLHFQRPPHSEMKMVRCLRGRLWDVAVDLRRGSSTFLHWHAQELTEDDAQMLVVPEGFAHGFQALEPDCELLYFCTAFYEPQSEGGLCHDDPRLAISWPLPPHGVSPRDLSHPPVGPDFHGIAL